MDSNLDRQDRRQLEQWIGGGSKTFTLLYSIQKNGCSATEFHRLCDNQGPTVTVLYNTNKSVFGGYTSISWISSESYISDDKAFLFQLTYNGNRQCRKLPVTNASLAIHDGASHGPIFGTGPHDLWTFSNSIQKSGPGNTFQLNGRCVIGTSFSNLGLTSDQFMNSNMNVVDLQVFKVTDGKDPYSEDSSWRNSPALNSVLFEELKEQVENYKPVPSLSLPQVRVLLLGPVGAGKSSFFNTINSVFRGRISHQGCSGSSDHSLTNVFNPSSPITPEFLGFNRSPALKDRIHCVAFVIDGSTVDLIAKPILEKIKSMQTRMNQIGIPQTVILTKVDKLSKVVVADISDVFKSEEVKDAVEKVSQMFGVPRGNVLPVKNYENEVRLDDKISALALLALQQILGFADDFLNNYLDKLEYENIQKLDIKE